MKRIVLSVLSLTALFAAENSTAQCGGSRYRSKVIDSVTIIKDIEYGSNFTYDATQLQFGTQQESQLLDVYLPNDANPNMLRPLIIFAHGGSFINGSKEDGDIVTFCNEFARRGFVTVSINYRLGYEQPIDSINATRGVYRALQDGRAAVRFMRSMADTFMIDTNKVFFGGTSAGAFIALNIAYLNLSSEVPSYVDTSEHSTINPHGLDGIEGKTNSLTNSSKIQGIINLCGATKTNAWMEDPYSGSIPVISMHGTEDQTVPYGRDFIYLNRILGVPQPDIPLIQVDGSYYIYQKAVELGIPSAFYTWCGAPHVPYIGSDSSALAYMDTTLSFMSRGIYEHLLGCGYTEGYTTNSSACFTTGIQNSFAETAALQVYPNPATSSLNVYNELNTAYSISVYNFAGQKVMEVNSLSGNIQKIDISSLNTGVYYLKLQSPEGFAVNKFIKN